MPKKRVALSAPLLQARPLAAAAALQAGKQSAQQQQQQQHQDNVRTTVNALKTVLCFMHGCCRHARWQQQLPCKQESSVHSSSRSSSNNKTKRFANAKLMRCAFCTVAAGTPTGSSSCPASRKAKWAAAAATQVTGCEVPE
jgi:hypothetical protein